MEEEREVNEKKEVNEEKTEEKNKDREVFCALLGVVVGIMMLVILSFLYGLIVGSLHPEKVRGGSAILSGANMHYAYHSWFGGEEEPVNPLPYKVIPTDSNKNLMDIVVSSNYGFWKCIRNDLYIDHDGHYGFNVIKEAYRDPSIVGYAVNLCSKRSGIAMHEKHRNELRDAIIASRTIFDMGFD